MSDFELQIAELKKKIEELEDKKGKILTYQFNNINFYQLENIVDIEQNFLDKEVFKEWFNSKKNISQEDAYFLQKLINKNEKLIDNYREEDLKMNFIAPILNKVDFLLLENKIRGYYENPLTYKSDKFILNGTTDFLISKGLKYAKLPYFFIQEFKRSRKNSDPEPQLLAELISAVELNSWNNIKGAYIVGSNWNFVILNRLEKHKYEYFVSRTFNSTNFEDLKGIYRNLLFVKKEIIEMVKRGE